MNSVRSSIQRGSQSLSHSRYICSDCHKSRSSRPLTANRDLHGFLIKNWSVLQHASISSIARQIREMRELPPLPTESIVELPRLPHQRKPRDEYIVRDDIQATLEAQYAANVLAHGSIHIKLESPSNSKPRRLAVTPPKKADAAQNILPFTPSEGNNESSLVRTAIARDSKGKRSTTRLIAWKNRARDITPSELRNKLIQAHSTLDASDRLDTEIRIFQEWIEPTKDEHDAALEIWSRFRQAVEAKFPEGKFELHGSRRTGLARPFSDIDIKLIIPKLEEKIECRGSGSTNSQVKDKYVKALKRIRNHINHNVPGFIVREVRAGRFPLLRIQGGPFNIELSAAVGKPIEYKTEFVRYFLNEYPQIKPLFFLIRWWLENLKLGDGMKGGVNSYLTFSMILTSITHSSHLFDHEKVGQQLLQFFRFWSKADWENLGFAADPARTFPKFAVNMVPENHWDDVQMTQDEAYQVSHTDLVAGTGLQETQLEMVSPLYEQNPTDTQTYPLGRRTIEVGDSAISENGGLESDVYLDGIKFLTHQANQLSQKGSLRETYFLLQDPADPIDNVGKSFTEFPRLRQFISKALHRLENNMNDWDKGLVSSSRHQSRKFLLEDLIYVEPTMATSTDDCDNYPLDLILQKFEKKRWRFGISIAALSRQKTSQLDTGGSERL